MWRLVVCDLETSKMPYVGTQRNKKKSKNERKKEFDINCIHRFGNSLGLKQNDK